jgi:hypothetical protein
MDWPPIMKQTLTTVGAFLVLSVSALAQETLFDNTTASRAGSDRVAAGSSLIGPLSSSFSTGGSASVLQTVSILLSQDTSLPSGSFSIRLLADSGSNTPGTLVTQIGTMYDTALPSSPTLYDFNLANSSCILAANTRYWIHLSSTSNTQALWSYAADWEGLGVDGEYFANDAGVFSIENGPYMMRVIVSTVPESPAFTAAAAMVLLGIGVWRRTRG